MKKGMVLLISAVILFGTLAPTRAIPTIAADQSINFTANGSYYWAMIWDYTNGRREDATQGPANFDTWLEYVMDAFSEVHVAYLYDWAAGRYIEAQALRNVVL